MSGVGPSYGHGQQSADARSSSDSANPTLKVSRLSDLDFKLRGLYRIATLRRVTGLAINLVTAIVAVIFVGLFCFSLFLLVASLPGILGMAAVLFRGERISLSEGLGFVFLKIILYVPLYLYAGIYLLPFVLTLPLNGLIVSLWEFPAQFLILRPFHRGVLARL
jgi:hypothetical protein